MGMAVNLSELHTNNEIDDFVLNHTNDELVQLTKSKLSQIYQARFGCNPRSNMTKMDIVREMRVHIKTAIRNKALLEMC